MIFFLFRELFKVETDQSDASVNAYGDRWPHLHQLKELTHDWLQ